MMAYACDPERAQNSNRNHFCLEFNFSSNFELSQDFRAKESELTREFDT